jgi:hypothetical protein
MAEPRQTRPGESKKVRSVNLRPMPADIRPRALPADPAARARTPRQVGAPPEVVLWGRCGLVPAASASEEHGA